ncbi:MAG: RdgB/HAM1 family non-canonical purine NTP pyrophosphatase [Vicinamibacteria bacterium]
MRDIVLASQNRDKLREIEGLIAGLPFRFLTPSDMGIKDSPEETETTFLGNARLKALHYAKLTGLPSVADDSGLSVDAMNGEPGVYSARFCGESVTYPQRFEEIWRRLRDVPDEKRTAHFTCAVVLATPGFVLFETEEHVDGLIVSGPRGVNGFGYDPIFFHPPSGCTTGELPRDQKDAISHRGQAFAKLRVYLQKLGTGEARP